MSKLSRRERAVLLKLRFNFRKLVECLVLGQFVVNQLIHVRPCCLQFLRGLACGWGWHCGLLLNAYYFAVHLHSCCSDHPCYNVRRLMDALLSSLCVYCYPLRHQERLNLL